MLDLVFITHRGFEDVCCSEISSLLGKKAVVDGRFVLSEVSDIKDVLRLCYLSQSCEFVLLKLSEGKTVEEAVSRIDESVVQWIDSDTRFVVKCERDFDVVDSQEIEALAAEKIIHISGAKVSFKQPELRVIVYVAEGRVIVGLDFALIDLSKRQHKIYKSNTSIKGPLAFCLYKLAKDPKVVLDPFCGSGEIVIEAALHESKKPVNFFQKDALAFTSNPKFEDMDIEKFFSAIDKSEKKPDFKLIASDSQLRHVKSVKSNAKIAGVEKYVDVMRMDIEWLDAKFDEGAVSCIITQPPEMSKNRDGSAVRKVLNELFHQAGFILEKKGNMITINRSAALLKELANNHGFNVVEERKVWSGKQEYEVVVFCK